MATAGGRRRRRRRRRCSMGGARRTTCHRSRCGKSQTCLWCRRCAGDWSGTCSPTCRRYSSAPRSSSSSLPSLSPSPPTTSISDVKGCLLGLTPLAERVSFLTEQIAFYTGPTVGGLFNATCGNVTELIIALFALQKRKIEVVKCSLVGSILSNLLLVLGTSLFFGDLANLRMEQLFERQVDVNTGLLLFGALCHILMLLLRYPINSGDKTVGSTASYIHDLGLIESLHHHHAPWLSCLPLLPAKDPSPTF